MRTAPYCVHTLQLEFFVVASADPTFVCRMQIFFDDSAVAPGLLLIGLLWSVAAV